MNIKFLLLTTTGVGMLGGMAGIGYWYSQPKNLKEALISENLTPLSKIDTTHTETWTNLAKKYATTDATPKITGFSISLQEQNLATGELDKFQKKCEDLFNKKPKDNEYINSLNFARAWCVKESSKLTS